MPPKWKCVNGGVQATSGCFSSSPTVVLDASGQANLFARACDGSMWLLPQRLWHRLKSSSTANVELSALEQHRHALPPVTETVGALLPMAAPKTAENALQPASLLELMQDDASLPKDEDDEPDDKAWNDWIALGGVGTTKPTVALDAEGMMHVFSRGITRALTTRQQFWNGSAVVWSPWRSLGGVLTSGPSVMGISDGSNLLNVYARGGDGSIWRKKEEVNITGNRGYVDWSKWESLGGVMSSGVAVTSTPDGLAEIFARGPDRAVWHKRESYRTDASGSASSLATSWSEWQSLEGELSSTPEVVQVPTLGGQVHVFGRGLDGHIYHRFQVGRPTVNGSVQWSEWTCLGGVTRLFACG